MGRFVKLTAELGNSAKERILAVWPENDIHWGFGLRTSRRPSAARVFFTDRRLLMVKLVSILSPGFVGTTLAVPAAEMERKRQNERMRDASPDRLLALDNENLQVTYRQLTEVGYDTKCLKIRFGDSTAKVQPVRSGGFLAYSHPDAVADPTRMIAHTIEILRDLPEIASKIPTRS